MKQTDAIRSAGLLARCFATASKRWRASSSKGKACSEPHLDRERFAAGILRRFRLARTLIRDAGLMPDRGDGTRFVQLLEPLARFGISRHRLRVAALQHADGPELAFANGDLPGVIELLAAADSLFVGRRRFVDPAQKE